MSENVLEIHPNRLNIIRRIVFISCFLFLDFLIINHLVLNKQDTKGVVILIFLIILLTCVVYPVLLSLFRVNHIIVDLNTHIINFKKLFDSQKYATHNITGFYTTTYKSKANNFKGVILKLDNKTDKELAGQNLQSIEKFQNYLFEMKIPHLGEKTSFFPFRRP